MKSKQTPPQGWTPMTKKEAKTIFARHAALHEGLKHLDEGIMNRGFVPMPPEVAMIFINSTRSIYGEEE